MDENPGQNTDLLEPSEAPEAGASIGERAADFGRGIKDSAKSAKDLLGKASGGAGDGISSGAGSGVGDALKNGLGSLASGGKGNGTPGIGGLNKSMDGMKGMGNALNTPSMFKGMEGASKPHTPNSPGSEKNPAAADSAKKMAGKVKDKAQQAASDIKEGIKDIQDANRIIASGATDVAAWADLAKRALKDPKAFIKRYGRYIMYAVGFLALQFALVAAIVGVLFFGIYKVYLSAKSVWDNPTDIANTLRVSTEMGGYLSKFVTQLTYERERQAAINSGAVLADNDGEHGQYDLSGLQLNPESEKMYEAWNNAGLAAKFVDDYNAEIKPNGSARQVDSYSPSAWDLYVSGKNMGPLSGTRAQAFIATFAEDTTHWKDIYTRKALQDSAKTGFDNSSFKLDLPDSENNISNSRKNTTQKIVKDTLQPVAKNAGSYYDCLVTGDDACDVLGLGSKDAPSNTERSGGLFGFIINAINRLKAERATPTKAQLVAFANSKADEITDETASYNTRDQLAANISTSASDSVLSGVDASKSTGAPDSETLLQMYDQFQTAVDNQNFSRVNYDRTSRQSVSQSLNYFVAGGQLLNNDMGLLDSWALTENLSIIEESQTLRQAVFGNPIGAYAQGSNTNPQVCQRVYNDGDPVRSVSENSADRQVKETSCFTPTLLPNINEFKSEKDLNAIYKQLDAQSSSYKSSGSGIFSRLFGNFAEKLARLRQNQSRTSPVSANSINIDDSLAPDLDAYTNQVYGVSKTGAEINGQAYDTMVMAAESLWSSAETSGAYSTGGSYQDDAAVAATMRFAKKFEQAQYAFKPASERLLSLKTPDSLAGKLALLTPTNSRDAGKKTLALLRPSNLTSAVASRLTPTTFAQATGDVNPVGAVRVGRSASDPNNTKPSVDLWNDNNCASGGPTQETAQPDGIPFTLPASSNPCKQVSVLATVATCYFDDEDSCSMGSGGSNGSGAAPGEISSDSTNIPCYPGTNLIGIRDDAYTKGERIRINLCEVPNIPCNNQECNELGNGHAVVSSVASEAWFKLAEKAKELNVPFAAVSTWRSMSHQQALCNANAACRGGTYNAVAKPGTSNHQAGVAIDLDNASFGGAARGRTCSNPQTANTDTYRFMVQYARTYGIKQYANESWHWGTAEAC